MDYKLNPATFHDRGKKKTPNRGINLALQSWCPNCDFEDFAKIDNDHRSVPPLPI
jgi:hypothetical protein